MEPCLRRCSETILAKEFGESPVDSRPDSDQGSEPLPTYIHAALDAERIMQTFRCYVLDEFDRIKAFVELSAVSDAEAIAQAERDPRLARKVFEVWRGREVIYRNQQVDPMRVSPLPDPEM